MSAKYPTEQVETIVIGGGQGGLAVGYYLKQRGSPFLVLDSHRRIGAAWRTRWDSMRLFTPAAYDRLPGMRFPAPRTAFPTKDEMADYLEAYATRFELPVRLGAHVDAVARSGSTFCVAAGSARFEASNVVVAISSDMLPRVPDFASELDSSVVQMHSTAYRNPAQLADGDVLIVGAGNSGADIALEAARDHRTWLSGRHPGQIPFPINSFTARWTYPFVRFGFHQVIKTGTPMGRRIHKGLIEGHGLPLVRVKQRDLANAGVVRVPRTSGVQDGHPLLEDGRTLEVANVIWCTGFRTDFSWIDVPVIDDVGEPRHVRGVVPDAPGLYFVGLHFLYAASSSQINGIGRDAGYIVADIARRASAAVRDRTGAQTRTGVDDSAPRSGARAQA